MRTSKLSRPWAAIAAEISGRLSLSSRHWSSALSKVGPNHPSRRNLPRAAVKGTKQTRVSPYPDTPETPINGTDQDESDGRRRLRPEGSDKHTIWLCTATSSLCFSPLPGDRTTVPSATQAVHEPQTEAPADPEGLCSAFLFCRSSLRFWTLVEYYLRI